MQNKEFSFEKTPTTYEQVNFGITKEIELPKFDPTKYIGMRVGIATIGEFKGEYGPFIKIETAPLETIGKGDQARDVRASRLFSLHEDENGQIGWTKESDLGVYLAKMKVAHYMDLVGREVVVQTKTTKKGKDVLTF